MARSTDINWNAESDGIGYELGKKKETKWDSDYAEEDAQFWYRKKESGWKSGRATRASLGRAKSGLGNVELPSLSLRSILLEGGEKRIRRGAKKFPSAAKAEEDDRGGSSQVREVKYS